LKLTKDKIKQLINEVASETSILLEEPVIAESSFNRVKGKVDNTDVEFIVMSADRHEKSRNENDARSKELKTAWKAAGFPFTEIDGSWVEKDKETGEDVRVMEKSIIVTDEERGDVERGELSLYEMAKALTGKYEQDAFIYGWIDKTGQRQIQARHADGSVAKYGGPWTSLEPIEKDADFWSRVRGSTFVFKEGHDETPQWGDHHEPYGGHPEPTNEGQEIVEIEAPNSVIEAMLKAKKHEGKKIKFIRRKDG